MRPLSDPSWDIQFQCDDVTLTKINIGWYWARPSPSVRELFQRAYDVWDETLEWDQLIMQYVWDEMNFNGTLTADILNISTYRSLMLFDWMPFYMDENKIDALNKVSVILHYTMVFGMTKVLAAKQFGHWVNETYYVQSPAILGIANVTGTTQEIVAQFSLIAYLARSTKRTFMWPNAVQHKCHPNDIPTARPPIIVVDPQTIDDTIPWVEGTYVRNRERYAPKPLTSMLFSLQSLASIQNVVSNIQAIKTDIVMVDLSKFDLAFLEREEVSQIIGKLGIKECGEVDSMARWTVYHDRFCEDLWPPWDFSGPLINGGFGLGFDSTTEN